MESSSESRKVVIDLLASALDSQYIFADVGQAMAQHLHTRSAAGAYASLTDHHAFAEAVTADLVEICNDGHLRFWYSPDDAASLIESQDSPEDETPEEWIAQSQFDNFGFAKIERLAGNVGYLDLRGFLSPRYAAPTAVAAMGMLAHSSAIIFDVRQNGGGWAEMVQFITSYLFDAEPRHLNSFEIRQGNQVQQFWTLPYVPGTRMPDVPVYVLTAGRTFSAAEEFAYNLKHMKRATIIGETTGGGAHPVDWVAVGKSYVISMPTGRAVNPITGTNWEGTGVEPDIKVPAADALRAAHLHALEHLISACTDERIKRKLVWEQYNAAALYNPYQLDPALMPRYVGKYGSRAVKIEDGVLKYTRGRLYLTLTAVSETEFIIDAQNRLCFELADSGQAVAMLVSNQDSDEPIRAERLAG